MMIIAITIIRIQLHMQIIVVIIMIIMILIIIISIIVIIISIITTTIITNQRVARRQVPFAAGPEGK